MRPTPTDIRHHRLVATFLHQCLGVDLEELRDETETVQEAVSDRVLQRIDVLLGHPVSDPHGAPIPPGSPGWDGPWRAPFEHAS